MRVGWRLLAGTLMGSLYALVLLFFTLASLHMGEGHGSTGFLLVTLFAPLVPLPGLYWALVGALLALQKTRVAMYLVLVHYATAIIFGFIVLRGEEEPWAGDVRNAVLLGLISYTVGQVAIWWRIKQAEAPRFA